MAKKQSSKEPKAKKDPKSNKDKADTDKVSIKPLDPPPPGGGMLGMGNPKKPKAK